MAENPRICISDVERRKSRSMSPQRWGALIGGSALAIYGVSRRSPLGIALVASGGTIAFLATKQQAFPESAAWVSVLVNCTPQDAYRFWRDFENLPRFMNRLESVTVLDNSRSRWTALGPAGRPIVWEAEITEERENESIAWRSLPDSDIEVNGRVEFREAPAGRGTMISARIEYSPILGASPTVANFLNKAVNFVMRQDLRRLEALMEAGEIPTIEGQAHGPRDLVTGVMRLADPTRPLRPGSSLKDTFAARRRIA